MGVGVCVCVCVGGGGGISGTFHAKTTTKILASSDFSPNNAYNNYTAF